MGVWEFDMEILRFEVIGGGDMVGVFADYSTDAGRK